MLLTSLLKIVTLVKKLKMSIYQIITGKICSMILSQGKIKLKLQITMWKLLQYLVGQTEEGVFQLDSRTLSQNLMRRIRSLLMNQIVKQGNLDVQ